MRYILPLVALVFAAPLVARSTAKTPQPAALVTSETALGGYVLGNPHAKIRLIEYMSFTCSHCAHFTTESAAPLKRDYVMNGHVTYEVRNAVRDPFDLTASLLARCGGSRRFFGNMEMLLATQPTWLANSQKLDSAKLQKADHATVLKMIGQGTGLYALMAKRGFSAAQLNQCLSDKGAQAKILAMTQDAWDVRKISGTPTFFINDTLADGTTTYEQLEPKLKAVSTATLPKTEVKP